jgi:hypothetical protein
MFRSAAVVGILLAFGAAGLPGSAAAAPGLDCADGVPGLSVVALKPLRDPASAVAVKSFRIRNSGPGKLRRLSVEAVLDGERVVAVPRAERGKVAVDGRTVHWTGDLRAGASADVVYSTVSTLPQRRPPEGRVPAPFGRRSSSPRAHCASSPSRRPARPLLLPRSGPPPRPPRPRRLPRRSGRRGTSRRRKPVAHTSSPAAPPPRPSPVRA